MDVFGKASSIEKKHLPHNALILVTSLKTVAIRGSDQAVYMTGKLLFQSVPAPKKEPSADAEIQKFLHIEITVFFIITITQKKPQRSKNLFYRKKLQTNLLSKTDSNWTRMTPVMNFCGFHGRVNSRRKQNYNRVQKYLEELKFITKIDTTRKVLSFSLSFQTV